MKKFNAVVDWCTERLPRYLVYAALFLAIVLISAQAAMHKGRELERERLVMALTAANAEKAEALDSLTAEMARKCWPVWEEDVKEKVLTTENAH